MITRKQVNEYLAYLEQRKAYLEDTHEEYKAAEAQTDNTDHARMLNSLAANCWTTHAEVDSNMQECERIFNSDPGYKIICINTYTSIPSEMEIKTADETKLTIECPSCTGKDFDTIIETLCDKAEAVAEALNPQPKPVFIEPIENDLREHLINDFETDPEGITEDGPVIELTPVQKSKMRPNEDIFNSLAAALRPEPKLFSGLFQTEPLKRVIVDNNFNLPEIHLTDSDLATFISSF